MSEADLAEPGLVIIGSRMIQLKLPLSACGSDCQTDGNLTRPHHLKFQTTGEESASALHTQMHGGP